MTLPTATIPQLPSASPLTGDEQIELAQSDTSVQTTLTTILNTRAATVVALTTNGTVAAFNLVIADTTSGPFTISLPSVVAFGQIIWFVDGAGTWNINNLVISPNGNKISGSTNTLIANIANNSFYLVYYNSTQGWVVGN